MPYTFKQIAGMSVDQISNLASRGDTYRDFCAAVKKAAKAAAAPKSNYPEIPNGWEADVLGGAEFTFRLRPMDAAPTGDDALEPQELEIHEGSWAIVLGTNAKAIARRRPR